MSLPVIIAVKNRPELTKQTVDSALRQPGMDMDLILIDDRSEDQATIDYLLSLDDPRIRVILMPDSKSCGAVKNAGAAIAAEHEFIYFSDNDVYFHDNWLKDMVEAMERHPELGILGGDRHPHHGNEGESDGVIYSDQQVGFSMLMRQSVFKELGPFVHAGLGVYGSEDTTICIKAGLVGYKVGAMTERVLTHCGLTNSSGGQAAGYPEFAAQSVPEGVIRI